jgi:hypothetical protein
MTLRYMGFNQERNTRAYKFDHLADGKITARFVVTADLTLFLRHHIGIQEGPTLCAQKLEADLLNPLLDNHELTGDDLQAHSLARSAAVEARQADSRRKKAQRRTVAGNSLQTPWRQAR